ncbi:Ribosomal large subunit pseudouridine synthase E [Sinobacterium norvegicum]|uniref:Pseudouridine synthase n=1 Tax=Sinobacterium norvegicum TaxID=1641715 RepID=A0ABM9ABR6_9GAMM|nr:pseudouridine synthase [Sinobacterium norvegicum]CAH0990327.1 Ribosomal large subunit pseudouridine synthase E [Sinobacterium norvegicum]
MSEILILNKPFNVLSQFTDKEQRNTLADYVNKPGFYAAGRLDYDSEGLLLLTNDGQLANRIADPKHKLEKTYLVQLEGDISNDAIEQLKDGVLLKDGKTRPAQAKRADQPSWLWPRTPPIRQRKNQPTCWIELKIKEGKNRQVRRMTAAVGHPTLRLIRAQIGQWHLNDLQPGNSRLETVHLPKQKPATARAKRGSTPARKASHKRR